MKMLRFFLQNVVCGCEYDDGLVFCIDKSTGQETWREDFSQLRLEPWGMTVLDNKVTTHSSIDMFPIRPNNNLVLLFTYETAVSLCTCSSEIFEFVKRL